VIVLYLRVSTEEQARRGYSLPEQREACRQRARLLAQELGQPAEIREFVDTFGGDVLERPVLEELRAFIHQERPAWFICMDPDRFARNLSAQLLITEEIERAGTRLAFVQHNYERTPEGQLFYQLRGAVSQFEKAKILERTSRGKQGKIKAGRRPNGAAPFGYRHDKETDDLVAWEPEAAWVRQIFRWVADEGVTPTQVALRLAAHGVPTRLGGRWRRSAVVEMLRNTSYIGQMRCNRHDSRGLGAIRRLDRARRGPITARLRPESEWRVVPVPPLVDAPLFEAVQRRLATVSRRGSRAGARLLSLLLRCGVCGGQMAYSRVAGRLYVRCGRRYGAPVGDPAGLRCTNRHHRAEPVEAGVWAQVCDWHLERDRQAVAAGDAAAGGAIAQEAALVRERLAECDRQQALVVQKQLRGLLSERVADSLLAEAREQAQRLERRVAELDARLADPGARPVASGGPEEDAARKALDGLDPAERRRLVLQVVQAVIIGPDGTWAVQPPE
jgi:site-specific DNA recombinase